MFKVVTKDLGNGFAFVSVEIPVNESPNIINGLLRQYRGIQLCTGEMIFNRRDGDIVATASRREKAEHNIVAYTIEKDRVIFWMGSVATPKIKAEAMQFAISKILQANENNEDDD